jgi:hypothetical protein
MRHSTDSNPPTPASLPAAVPTAARRAAIVAAVEAHNQANPDARLPRSAARLLLAMFPADDEFRGSQELLRDAGFGSRVWEQLRALITAGLLSRQQNGTKGAPITYRLLLP